jgi:hypothetical protein
MKEKGKKITQKGSEMHDNKYVSAIKQLQKLSEIRGMTFQCKINEAGLIVERKPNHILFIILYTVYFLLPVLVIGQNIRQLYYMLLLYYPLFFLLIWNTTRKTKSIKIDSDNRVLTIKNNNILGMLIRKKETFSFDNVEKFEAEYTTNKRQGKTFNHIFLKPKNVEKKIFLIELVADGASLRNGNKFVEVLNSLIL